MLPIYSLLLNLLVTLVAGALVFAGWVANRKRIAAETIGRADEQARRTLIDAERDAETRKKEAHPRSVAHRRVAAFSVSCRTGFSSSKSIV